MSNQKPIPLRLTNPFLRLRSEDRIRVQATIDPIIDRYFFKGILPEQGHPQNLIGTFFNKLFEAVKSRNIGLTVPGDLRSVRWDETCEHQVAELMNNLNFNPQPVEDTNGKPTRTSSRPRKGPARPPATGCSNPPPAEPAA